MKLVNSVMNFLIFWSYFFSGYVICLIDEFLYDVFSYCFCFVGVNKLMNINKMVVKEKGVVVDVFEKWILEFERWVIFSEEDVFNFKGLLVIILFCIGCGILLNLWIVN